MAATVPNKSVAHAAPSSQPTNDPLNALVSLIKLGSGEFTLGTVQYEQPSQRRRIITRLHRALPDKNLVTVSLQDSSLDLLSAPERLFTNLERIARRNDGGKKIDAVLLVDWDKRLRHGLPLDQQPSTALVGLFNIGRDILKKHFPCPLIVLSPNWAAKIVQHLAPDLISWRSGSFDFPSDTEAVITELQEALQAAYVPKGNVGAVTQWLASALGDAQTLDSLDGHDEQIPEAMVRLGELYLQEGKAAEAMMQFERLSSGSDSDGSKRWRRRVARGRRRATRAYKHKAQSIVDSAWWKVFRGAASLGSEDTIIGREEDLLAIVKMVSAPKFRCGTLWGETGCGKTSLVRAGLIPDLEVAGHRSFYLNDYGDPVAALCSALIEADVDLSEHKGSIYETIKVVSLGNDQNIFLWFDQFEQAYVEEIIGKDALQAFLLDLARCINDLSLSVRCVFLLRADHLYHLFSDFDRLTPLNHPLATANRYELRWLRQADAERVLARLGEQIGMAWPPELITTVVADLSRDDRVRPVEIQLVGASLFLRKITTVSDYERAGRKDGVLKGYLNAIFDTVSYPMLARGIVRALVLPSDPPVRVLLTTAEIAASLDKPVRKIESLLKELEKPHVVVPRYDDSSTTRYELVHDILTEAALRATTSQEIGFSIIYTALMEERRYLGLRSYWRAVQVDLSELTKIQQSKARQLIHVRTLLVLIGVLIGILSCVFVLAVQYITIHVDIDDEIVTQPVVFRRGLPALDFLPGLLGATPLFDTGISFKFEMSPHRRSLIEELTTNRWADTKYRADLLIPYMNPLAKGKWRCYLGEWEEGMKLLLSEEHKLVPAFVEIHPNSAILPLVSLLLDSDSDPNIQLAASDALEKSFVPDEQLPAVIRALITVAGDQEGSDWIGASKRAGAVKALGVLTIPDDQLPAVIQALSTATGDQESQARAAAARALGQRTIPDDQLPAVIQALITATGDQESQVRAAAARALGRLPIPDAQLPAVIQALITVAGDQDADVRAATASALGRLPIPDAQLPAVIQALITAAGDQEWEVRMAAVMALDRLPIPDAQLPAVIQALITAARNEDGLLREFAAQALSQLLIPDTQLPALIQALITATGDQESQVRATAAMTLGRLPIPDAQLPAVIQALITATGDQDADVLAAAAKALGRLPMPDTQLPAVIQALITAAGDQKGWGQATAARILGELPIPDTQLPAVIQALITDVGDQEWQVRAAAVQALGRLPIPDTQLPAVIQALITAAGDQESRVRAATASALGRLPIPDTQLPAVIQALITAAGDQESRVRAATASALGRLPIPDVQLPTVIQTLIIAAGDQDADVRAAAAMALGRLPIPDAQLPAVIQALITAAGDQGQWVQKAAARALNAISLQYFHLSPELLKWLKNKTVDNSADLRKHATQFLGRSFLAETQEDQNAIVYQLLLNRLTAQEDSRLHSGYRRALVNALAYWYNAGRGDANETLFSNSPRAQQEHADLQKDLENLRDTGPMWLRAAAAEVWVRAYQLRQDKN